MGRGPPWGTVTWRAMQGASWGAWVSPLLDPGADRTGVPAVEIHRHSLTCTFLCVTRKLKKQKQQSVAQKWFTEA